MIHTEVCDRVKHKLNSKYYDLKTTPKYSNKIILLVIETRKTQISHLDKFSYKC